MVDYRLDTADEYSHTPGPESNFNESVYVNGWDMRQKVGLWSRVGNRINEGHAEVSVCIYLPDGRVACQFLRPEIASNDKHAAAGLSYQVLEPFKRVAMTYEGEAMVLSDPQILRTPKAMFKTAPRVPCSFNLQLEGISPMNGGEPTDPDAETMYGRDFSLGHFNQHTRTTGDIVVGEERWQLDGHGWRDHSWGPRYWTNIYYYRLFVINYGDDRALMMLKRVDREGNTHRRGVLLFDNKYEPVLDMDVMTQWDDNKDPMTVQLGIRTDKRKVRMEGTVRTVAPLRNHRQVGDRELECRIVEAFTDWQWDDGRPGIGITEYIEFIEDGEPVGYPL